MFPPLERGGREASCCLSWRGAAAALNLPGLASLRTEGGGVSVWNSPGSWLMLAAGKSKARTSTSVTQVNSAVFESRFQIHILYLQSEIVFH